jgi:hypothetical protein
MDSMMRKPNENQAYNFDYYFEKSISQKNDQNDC